MSEEFKVTIVWQVEDIQSVRPSWTKKQCEEFLSEHKDNILERSVEEGWSVIETLLEIWHD